MGNREYTIRVKRREVVAAALPMYEHWLPMSNLDLLLPALDFGVFLCYKGIKYVDHYPTMKKALAKVLVSYYALAGEVVNNSEGEPELLCNNRGVDICHAYADIELKDLDLYHPDVSIHAKLIPVKKHGVLSVQVTELKSSGLVVGCTFDHRVADAHSANMFLVAWADIAQGKRITMPSYRRSQLNSRRPPLYDPFIDTMYIFLSSLALQPKQSADHDQDPLTSRIYYIMADQIALLQFKASGSGSKRSKVESFSAFLWKTIAEGGVDDSKMCKLGIIVDGRQRMTRKGSMENYFGNVLSIPYSEASVGQLKEKSLSKVADLVHSCLQVIQEDHFLSLIDWVELHRPKQATVKVYCKDENYDEAAIVVSSGLLFPVSQVNFGWGNPDFGTYQFPWGGQAGYVMPMPSPTMNGDWIVYMHLHKKHLDFLETRAPHFFNPLTHTFLDLTT